MKNQDMPWCDWCNSYHHRKCPHIARQMWLLPNISTLFKFKAEALRMGFGAEHKPIKVEVRPL